MPELIIRVHPSDDFLWEGATEAIANTVAKAYELFEEELGVTEEELFAKWNKFKLGVVVVEGHETGFTMKGEPVMGVYRSVHYVDNGPYDAVIRLASDALNLGYGAYLIAHEVFHAVDELASPAQWYDAHADECEAEARYWGHAFADALEPVLYPDTASW